MPPAVDLEGARHLVDFLVGAAQGRMLKSAHDASAGGLGVALAEMAIGGPYQEAGMGLTVDLSNYAPALSDAELLFSESHNRAVLTVSPDRVAAVTTLARQHGVSLYPAGTIGPPGTLVSITLRGGAVSYPVGRLREVYFGSIPRRMGD
jgi:phosphoribosylformylglycinamidine synthase